MITEAFHIDDTFTGKWQGILDLLAKLSNVPAALIMRIVDDDICVFVASSGTENPYHVGDKENYRNSGLYCETVVNLRKMLKVPNALADENWKNNPDVKLNMISYLGFPILYPDDRPFGTICILDSQENQYSDTLVKLLSSFRDVVQDDLKIIDNNLTIARQNEELVKYDLMMREVHHRIKNNIVGIESMLSIQAVTMANSESRVAIQDAINRIQSMKIIYEKLLVSSDCTTISVCEYMKTLVPAIVQVMLFSRNVKIDYDIDDVILDSKQISLLGTITNELVTNAIKYAFRNSTDNHLFISFKTVGTSCCLTVSDNGSGLPADFDIAHTTGFGLSLVRNFVRQHDGKLEIDSGKGASFRITWSESAA